MKFTDEDKEMVARLIRGFEYDLEELRNDKYGHAEIVSDIKESCREKIGWLETFQKRMEQEQARNYLLTDCGGSFEKFAELGLIR